jgi:tRNA G18 (ribose-2'-O)-methylase SpoU
MKKRELYLILPNIRSNHNVGSIFRTAEAAGVKKNYLTGYTPRPVDQFGRTNTALAKVALGAEKTLAWEYQPSAVTLINRLKKTGLKIVALEQASNSVDYRHFKPTWPMALVLGEEVEGLPPNLLKLADQVIEIPMLGQKESLNVSVAAGLAIYRLLGL